MKKPHFNPGLRAAKLKPVQTKRGWMVSIPPSMSRTGKRRRRFFQSQRDAVEYGKQMLWDRREFGQLLTEINHHQLSEAVRAFDLLRPHEIGLLEAVTAYLDIRKSREQGSTFGEVFDAYAELSGRSQSFDSSIRHLRANLHHLMDRPASDVTTEDFESAFSDMPPGTKEFRIRRLRVVLNYAARKGLIEKNAANALDLPAAKLDEIHSYSAEHVERMLRTALSNDRILLPYLAVCAFCGLRPEREAYHLDWSDVHLDDDKPEIVVSPELSKTRRRRFVEISANCAAWLRASRVERVGRVMPYPESTFNKRRRANRKQAGVPLIADGLRHAFCSAHLAYHGDLNRLLLMSGHTNPQILWRHYYRHFSKDEAQRYWSIMP